LLGSTVVQAGATPFAWQEFAFRVSLDPGDHVLIARATDRGGNTQPVQTRWNALGYANNAARPTRVRVRV
jgi:Mo-co oxidoreductase dimerisation domain